MAATRRSFLQAAGGTAAATALAGCNSSLSRSEQPEAAPAILAEPGERGYSPSESRSLSRTVERSSGGSTEEVPVTSVLRAYQSEGTPTPWVGTLSSPVVEVAGEEVSRLGGDPIADVLGNEAEQLLVDTALSGRDAVSWRLDPASVGEFDGLLLDRAVTGRTVVGATESDEVVVVHAARTRNEGDVVLVASVRAYPRPETLPSTPGDLLGTGVVPGSEVVADQQTSFVDVLERVRHAIDGTAAPPAVVGDDVDPRAVISDVTREPMGGGRDRIMATRTLVDADEGPVSRRVRLVDTGFQQRLAERAPDLGDDVSSDIALPPQPTDSPDGLLGRVRRTLGAARATIGTDGGTDDEEAASPAGASVATQTPDKVSLKSDQTPLKNQFGRGTCVSFAACSAMEAAYNRAGYGELDLSEQYLNHLQKTAFLQTAGQRNPDGTLSNEGFENFLAFSSGSDLGYMLPLLATYGVPREQDAQYQPSSYSNPYYVNVNDYQNLGQPGDSYGSYNWNDPSSMSQDTVNEFNLQDEETTYQIAPDNENFRITPFPESALEAAHYGIDSYAFVHENDSNGWLLERPTTFERVLALGHEVIISYRPGETQYAANRPRRGNYSSKSAHDRAVQQWRDNDGDVKVYNSSGSGGGHCICLVGYDTTGNRDHFVAKDNYNNYEKMGYDLFENGVIYEAGYIRSVRNPTPDAFHPQDILGRYEVTYDDPTGQMGGGSGTLDVFRLPEFFEPEDLPGGSDQPTEDLRIGSFRAADGTLYRVNGAVVFPVVGANGQVHDSFAKLFLYVDFDDPNQPFDAASGTQFVCYVNEGDISLMAGHVVDSFGDVDGGFHATTQPFAEGTARGTSGESEALPGEWTVHSPFVADGATLVVETEVSVNQNSFTARVRNRNSPPRRSDYSAPLTGTQTYSDAEQVVRFELDSDQAGPGGVAGTFEGYLHLDTLAHMSGTYTYGSDDAKAPMVLVREDIEPFVEITSPADGATVTVEEGSEKRDFSKDGLTLEAFLVGPPGATVRWRATNQATGQTTILGTGEQVSPALAPGTFDIEASYVGSAQPDAQITDTITITVESES